MLFLRKNEKKKFRVSNLVIIIQKRHIFSAKVTFESLIWRTGKLWTTTKQSRMMIWS